MVKAPGRLTAPATDKTRIAGVSNPRKHSKNGHPVVYSAKKTTRCRTTHSVPELTYSGDIKLNTRVSLWPAGAALSFSHRILSIRTQHSEVVRRSYSALTALFFGKAARCC